MLLALFANTLAGQQGVQSSRVRKNDLIRMLVAGVPDKRSVAARVRLTCLSFAPSERDLSDIRLAGADSGVMNAIAECTRGNSLERPSPSPSPPAEPDVRSEAMEIRAPAVLRAYTRSTFILTARAIRGTVPQPGITLEVRATDAVPDGMTTNRETTNGQGVASFRIPSGSRPGRYRLEVGLQGSTPGAEPVAKVELMTVARPQVASPVASPSPRERSPEPGPVPVAVARPAAAWPLQAEVRPGEILIQSDSDIPIPVLVVVRDTAGRPVEGVRLEFAVVTAERAIPLDPATTDEQGIAALSIPAVAARRIGSLGVFARGTRIGLVPIRSKTIAGEEERTRFIAGSGQRGPVNTTLRQQLALEVRDSAGIPIVNHPVTFKASNGQVRPETTRTDSAGVARVTVTLGDKAGPVTITGTAGAERRQALLYAMPGTPARLAVERDGVPIERTLSLSTRAPVTLTVTIRDAYGNGTLLSDLRVTAKGRAVGVETGRDALTPGAIVVKPRRSGKGEIAIRASGLRAAVPVEVSLPQTDASWILGARGGGVALSYRMRERRPIDGSLGYRADFFLGHRFGSSGLTVEGGMGMGTLHADTAGGLTTARLSQGYVRAEYALAPAASVAPVVALGGGWYRLQSDDPAHILHHTGLFVLGALGANLPLGPMVVGEIRAGTQRLYEIGSPVQRGLVATLTTLEVGMRIAF